MILIGSKQIWSIAPIPADVGTGYLSVSFITPVYRHWRHVKVDNDSKRLHQMEYCQSTPVTYLYAVFIISFYRSIVESLNSLELIASPIHVWLRFDNW